MQQIPIGLWLMLCKPIALIRINTSRICAQSCKNSLSIIRMKHLRLRCKPLLIRHFNQTIINSTRICSFNTRWILLPIWEAIRCLALKPWWMREWLICNPQANSLQQHLSSHPLIQVYLLRLSIQCFLCWHKCKWQCCHARISFW